MEEKTKNNLSKKLHFRIEDNIIIGDELVMPDEPFNAGEVILEIFKSKPDFVAQIDHATGKENTFGTMMERSVKCAIWLKKQGIRKGDVVAVSTVSHLDEHVPFLACLYIGAVCATKDDEITAHSARSFMSLMEPKIMFLHKHTVPIIKTVMKDLNTQVKLITFEDLCGNEESMNDIISQQTAAEVNNFRCTKIENPREVAAILSSSGTTGLPKGVEVSHLAFRVTMRPENLTSMKDAIVLWIPNISWLYGVMKLLKSIPAFSKRIIALDVDDVEIYCQLIEKYQVEFFGPNPSMMMQLLKCEFFKKYNLRSLKTILVGGAPFKRELHEECNKVLPHASILQTYGSTDAGNAFTKQMEGCQPGGCGFVMRSVRVKIADLTSGEALGPNKRGEICVITPTAMIKYHKNPEATKKVFDSEGWLHTGDIGYYDEVGEIYVVDRISDFINYRGTSLSSAEIEVVLQTHPAVYNAAVIPLPSELEGELPLAIITKIPNKTVTEQELIDYVDEHLPEYYGLRGGVKFVDTLPRTSSGKIMKRELKRLYGKASS